MINDSTDIIVPTIPKDPSSKRGTSQPPEGYRGLHRLNKYPEGRIKCVACEMCSAACPADCIDIIPGPSPWDEGKERYPVRFDIDLLRCIFCSHFV